MNLCPASNEVRIFSHIKNYTVNYTVIKKNGS
nr:MAG TPA: hypothetical protein [Caudoviricetes sp.]